MAADVPGGSSACEPAQPRRKRAPLAGVFRMSRSLPSSVAAAGQFPGIRRIARRPAVPPFWINIAPVLRQVKLAAAYISPPGGRERYWLLVLEAKGIARAVSGKNQTLRLYVPPTAALAALHEITAFEQERPDAPLPEQPAKPLSYWVIALLALLVLWHRMRWTDSPHLPGLPLDPQEWLRLGGLDAYRVKAVGEWWRCLTALTLHADEGHLLSNVLTGSLFCLPLCRRVGLGTGVLLTVLAGALGNAATVLFRPASFISQGFSTAVFAAVGLLSAVAACHAFQHTMGITRAVSSRTTTGRAARAGLHRAIKKAAFAALLPLGAGLGFLAMLGGSDSPRVDYLAHSMGLFCGIGLGLGTGVLTPGLFQLRGKADQALQAGCLAAAFALLAFSWIAALT